MLEVFSPGRRAGSLPIRRRSVVRAASLLLCLAFFGACQTSSDAKVVATQLAATATALSNYYAAIHTEILDIDQLNDLDQGVLGMPYDVQTRAGFMDNAAEIQKRADLANDISTLAASLTQLATSTGAADATAAAGRLVSAAASIGPLGGSLPSSVPAGIVNGAQALFTAIQEHKIRAAASGIAVCLHNFDKLFSAEEYIYASFSGQYVDLSGQLSGWFVRNGQTDPAAYSSALAKMALSPYGLTAKIDAATQAKIAATTQMSIDQKSADMKAAQIEAGKAMEDALADIATRAGDLAANKPLPTGITPPSLAIVNQWAATLAAK
ncbi:MAG: hypothetical protein ACRD27_02295 [Terracidiphilus sp.]